MYIIGSLGSASYDTTPRSPTITVHRDLARFGARRRHTHTLAHVQTAVRPLRRPLRRPTALPTAPSSPTHTQHRGCMQISADHALSNASFIFSAQAGSEARLHLDLETEILDFASGRSLPFSSSSAFLIAGRVSPPRWRCAAHASYSSRA